MHLINSEPVHLINGISSVPWDVLNQLNIEQLNSLGKTGNTRKLKKGDFAFRTGDNSDGVFFLKSGKIKVCHPLSSGKEVNLWFCFAGDVFGLAEAAHESDRSVSAQACEDSEVWNIPRSSFNAFLFENPQVMFLLLQVLSSRLRCLSESLANIAGEQVQTRLVHLMLWLCERYGKNDGNTVDLIIQLTHQEIADMIGTTRQSVSSLMSDFKRKGLLETHKQHIHIKDHRMLINMLH